MALSPLISITLSALASHFKPPFVQTKPQVFVWTFFLSIFFFALPPHSILSWWQLLTRILSQWPLLFRNPPAISKGGPLGVGCAKVCEVGAAILLWYGQQHFALRLDGDESKDSRIQEFPIVLVDTNQTNDSKLWLGIAVVVVVSVLTNIVLHVWSLYQEHDHDGVKRMARKSVGRSLTTREHAYLLLLAAMNATCEEFVSRGVWKYEYSKYTTRANVFQAAVFGMWHYHGIPSGWTGVALTFVYGFIMGLLQDYFGGLLLPILAHTIADYFIFSVIARKKQEQRVKRQ